MPDITLPRRAPGLTTRRRSVAAPTAADVPVVDPAVARDPGLVVPEGAFGGGFGEGLETLGGTLSDIAEDVRREAARQKKLNEATNQVAIRQDAVQALRGEFDRREAEDDFADPVVPRDFIGFVDSRIEAAKGRARGLTGASRLDEAAMAGLDRDLEEIGQLFRDRGDTLYLRAVERRGLDQLNNFIEEATDRARRFVGLAPGDEAYFTLDAELHLFDEAIAPFAGAFRDGREQDIRTEGRARIIGAAVTGLAERGRGEEARALLDHEDFAGDLDDDTRSRLGRDTVLLSEAHDRDRALRDQRAMADDARDKESSALAFARDFRARLATGAAGHAEIAAAETAGTLGPGRAATLRAELDADTARRDKANAGAGRVAALLEAGSRPDPGNPDHRADVAHHYEATLKPALAELDPARKAAAIGAYVKDIGIAPDAAFKSLLGLAVAGQPEGRIAAARALTDLLVRDPGIRDRVPPALAEFADLMRSLADTDAVPPGEIVRAGDAFLRELLPRTPDDQPNPGLRLLAAANADTAVPSDQPTVEIEPDATTNETESSGDAGGDEDGPEGGREEEDKQVPGEDDPTVDEEDDAPEFPPDDLARLNDLLGDPDPDPDLGERRGTSGAFRRAADRVVASLDEAKANASEAEKAAGELILSLVPGLGEVMSAGDAVNAFREADKLLKEGKLDEALEKEADGSLAAFGAIPFVGKLAKVPVRFKSLVKAADISRATGTVGLKGRRAADRIVRLESTRSPNAAARKQLGIGTERQRLRTLQPRNDFAGPRAFSTKTPEDAFAATRFPPRSDKENAFRGLAAVDLVIQDALSKGAGTLHKAMRRSGLPGGQEAITFRWGKPGSGPKFRGGSGLSHIIAKHGVEVMEDVVETISKGKIVGSSEKSDRLLIKSGNDIAVIGLIKGRNRQSWVLTGYERGKPDQNFNLRELTGPIFFKPN